jgi:hypothetical protein
MELNSVTVNVAREHVIDLIRNFRNDLAKDFLDERHVKSYFADRYHIHELDSGKVDAIKHDLKELLVSPLDTQHYGQLISQLNELTPDALKHVDINPDLFYKEIQKIFIRYMF